MATDTDARVLNASLELRNCSKNMKIIHDFAIRRLDPPPPLLGHFVKDFTKTVDFSQYLPPLSLAPPF